MEISSKHHYTQTIRVSELKFWENFHPPPCVRCQVSGVNYYYNFFFLQNGGAYRGRVCYQRALPRLVLVKHSFFWIFNVLLWTAQLPITKVYVGRERKKWAKGRWKVSAPLPHLLHNSRYSASQTSLYLSLLKYFHKGFWNFLYFIN